MRTRFHQSLDELKEKLLRMGGMAEQAVDRANEAYRRRDVALCRRVLDAEHSINIMEREIDELALDLLAMQQPMAVDLRFIVAVVKINADLERVGDQAVNVVQRVLELAKLPEVDLSVDIPKVADTAAKMVRIALESFIYARADVAETVLKLDDELDELNAQTYHAMLNLMQKSPELTPQALNALLISRNLERVGDHATNIAEDVIFWVRGADVRHHFDAAPSTDAKAD
ncbi:MAG TPA: phosphate signaling complex protein PhoU [Terriglobales bacterium]|nr:phosphate signaling complex protein PhoU [Terriglobales bacterium]